MRFPALRTFAIVAACTAPPLLAQEADVDEPGAHRLTVMAGLGNTFAGFGGTVEYWFPRQASVVAGLGTGLDTGVEAALGLRLFTGQRHRLFLEAVYAPIAVSDRSRRARRARYGPGMTVGYGYTSDGGFSGPLRTRGRRCDRGSMQWSWWPTWASAIPGDGETGVGPAS